MWTLHRQQQQRGAQMPARGAAERRPGDAPADATAGRDAQQHDRAGDQTLQPGDYPASPLPHGDHDDTPTAPEPDVAWDEVVQPESAPEQGHGRDDLPLPEGK